MAYLWIVSFTAFAIGIATGIGAWLGYDWWRKENRVCLTMVNPATNGVRRIWKKPPKDKRYVTVDNVDVALGGEFGYNGDFGNEFLVDANTGKPMRIPEDPVPEDAGPVERMNGKVFNELRQDERMRQWHAYQSSGLEKLARYALPALVIIGLTVIAILMTVLQGFGYMGS